MKMGNVENMENMEEMEDIKKIGEMGEREIYIYIVKYGHNMVNIVVRSWV